MTKLLLEGRPSTGKTTVARAVVESLVERGLSVSGITTEELRAAGRRVGFSVEAIGGDRATLAHVDFDGPPRIGKYGVDVAALERIALPALVREADVIVIDELGKMELASEAFRAAIEGLFEGDVPILATVQAFEHPFTDALKARPDVAILRVTRSNRAGLPDRVVSALDAT